MKITPKQFITWGTVIGMLFAAATATLVYAEDAFTHFRKVDSNTYRLDLSDLTTAYKQRAILENQIQTQKKRDGHVSPQLLAEHANIQALITVLQPAVQSYRRSVR